MSKFPTYKLTDKQIRGIANIVLHEQGTVAGQYAEASQIANLCELRYKGDPVTARTAAASAEYNERLQARADGLKAEYAEGFEKPNLLEYIKG